MFTGGTIWLLTHGQMLSAPPFRRIPTALLLHVAAQFSDPPLKVTNFWRVK